MKQHLIAFGMACCSLLVGCGGKGSGTNHHGGDPASGHDKATIYIDVKHINTEQAGSAAVKLQVRAMSQEAFAIASHPAAGSKDPVQQYPMVYGSNGAAPNDNTGTEHLSSTKLATHLSYDVTAPKSYISSKQVQCYLDADQSATHSAVPPGTHISWTYHCSDKGDGRYALEFFPFSGVKAELKIYPSSTSSKLVEIAYTNGHKDNDAQSNFGTETVTELNIGGKFKLYRHDYKLTDYDKDQGITVLTADSSYAKIRQDDKSLTPFVSYYYGLPHNIQYKLQGDATWRSPRFDASQSQYPNSFSAPVQASHPVPSEAHVVGDYYGNWTSYEEHRVFQPSNIPFYDINTLNYAFENVGYTDATAGQALMLDSGADAERGNLTYIALVGSQITGLNLVLSFGGWGSINNNNFTSSDLAMVFQNYPKEIPALARDMVQAMLQSGFNGIDIDYEWKAPVQPVTSKQRNPKYTSLCDPAQRDPKADICVGYLSANMADGYAELMQDLRKDLDALPARADAKRYILSTALMASTDGLQQLQNVDPKQDNLAAVFTAADRINLMTYDMHGAFDAPSNAGANGIAVTASSAPIDAAPDAQGKVMSINAALHWLNAGNPKKTKYNLHKVVLGIPAYGHIVKTISASPVARRQAASVGDGLGLPLAAVSAQALPNTTAGGEFIGDYWQQTLKGDAKGALKGSATYDYKCIAERSLCIDGQDGHGLADFADGDWYQPAATGLSAQYATPWGYSAAHNLFISYDDNISADKKMHSVVQKQGLLGAFIWEADADITPDSKLYATRSIVHTVYKDSV